MTEIKPMINFQTVTNPELRRNSKTVINNRGWELLLGSAYLSAQRENDKLTYLICSTSRKVWDRFKK